ncbi:IS5 family transposase [Streptomyces sp. NPDC006739]|uniref:IS5 family transposase n=1 Tax=Streptomyces sp. NPDC006739 TaxID=3364763 RepID=UPI00369A866B
MPVLPSWLTEPLWEQFAALLPKRPTFDPAHPLGCHRRRISERIVFDKLLQTLRFGCSYEAIADATCSATTIRNRRDEWISLGVFSRLKQIALDAYDRVVGLVLDQISVDGAITKAPGGGEAAGRSPVDRGKQGMKRSGMTDGYGIPLGRVLAGANRHDSPLLAPTLDLLNGLGPLPDQVTVHLDAGYDSVTSRSVLNERNLQGQIARKGTKAPVQATRRWHVERTHAWQNSFHRLARCYERRTSVIEAFFDLADTVITVRNLLRRAWTTHRWDTRPRRRP